MKGLADVGAPLMLALGVILIISSIAVFLKGKGTAPTLATMLVFGTLLCGTGSFGFTFMREFGAFLRATELLKLISEDPSPEAQQEVAQAVANGEVSKPLAHAMLSSVLEGATPRTGEVLERAASVGSSTSGRAMVLATRDRLREKELAASDLTESLAERGRLDARRVSTYDPLTRRLVVSRVAGRGSDALPGPPISPATAAAILRIDHTTSVTQ